MEIANFLCTFGPRSPFLVSCSYEKLSRRLPGLINLPFHPDTSRSSDGEFNQQIRWTSKPSAFVSLAHD